MGNLLKRCASCGRYTISPGTSCPYCGGPLKSAHPPPFSLKLARYAPYVYRGEKEF